MKNLILFFLVLLLIFLSGCSDRFQERYEELESEYDALQEEYDALIEEHYALIDEYSTAIGHCEDPIIILYRFFEDEEDVSFDEAYDAMMTIRSELYQFY